MANKTNLTEFLDTFNEKVDGDHVSVGDMLAAFKQQGFGPLLLAPSLIVLLPTGAIPGVPTVCALFICLVNAQQLVGLDHPWLPGPLRRSSIERGKFEAAVNKAKPITRRIDRVIRPHYTQLVEPPAGYMIALISMVLALFMIPLEVIPFAAALPALAIAFFALGLTANDGVLVIIGLVVTAIAAVVGFMWWS